MGWSRDSRAVYVQQGFEVPARIERVDLASGARTVVQQVAPVGEVGRVERGEIEMKRSESLLASAMEGIVRLAFGPAQLTPLSPAVEERAELTHGERVGVVLAAQGRHGGGRASAADDDGLVVTNGLLSHGGYLSSDP